MPWVLSFVFVASVFVAFAVRAAIGVVAAGNRDDLLMWGVQLLVWVGATAIALIPVFAYLKGA